MVVVGRYAGGIVRFPLLQVFNYYSQFSIVQEWNFFAGSCKPAKIAESLRSWTVPSAGERGTGQER